MQSDAPNHLAWNLTALASTHPTLCSRIEKSTPNPTLGFRLAKNGAAVPVIRDSSGDQPLHSLVDPQKEAERLAQSLGECGYLICLGLGGGYLPAAFLRRRTACGVLIVEKDTSTLKVLLANPALSTMLQDLRVHLTAGIEEIRGSLVRSYLPSICGTLRSFPLRPWCRAEQKFFEKAAEELSLALQEARADFDIQAHFGKRWFANIIANLPTADGLPVQFGLAGLQGRCAHVTAAGPSLEHSLEELRLRRDRSIVVATDTSLPALVRSGIHPEIVVSIDCQLYTYHHFLVGFPSETTFFFDLASPPFVVRRTGARARFLTSAHPFSMFLSKHWRRFPVVDTTGGNVTHAAVSLALAFGIQELRLHGADFGYPRAKPYARGTYLFDHFMTQAKRYTPIESSLTTFVIGNSAASAERASKGIRYSTPLLRDYKERLDRMMAREQRKPNRTEVHEDQVSAASCGWREFLGRYAEALRAIPAPTDPAGVYYQGLTPDLKEILTTILPITACIQRGTQGTEASSDCLEQSRRWALTRVTRSLSAASHGP
jgi:hypothetical protein